MTATVQHDPRLDLVLERVVDAAAEPPAETVATCASAAARSAATAGLGHVDPDRLRHDRGIVWHMIFVPEQELKRMPPR